MFWFSNCSLTTNDAHALISSCIIYTHTILESMGIYTTSKTFCWDGDSAVSGLCNQYCSLIPGQENDEVGFILKVPIGIDQNYNVRYQFVNQNSDIEHLMKNCSCSRIKSSGYNELGKLFFVYDIDQSKKTIQFFPLTYRIWRNILQFENKNPEISLGKTTLFEESINPTQRGKMKTRLCRPLYSKQTLNVLSSFIDRIEKERKKLNLEELNEEFPSKFEKELGLKKEEIQANLIFSSKLQKFWNIFLKKTEATENDLLEVIKLKNYFSNLKPLIKSNSDLNCEKNLFDQNQIKRILKNCASFIYDFFDYKKRGIPFIPRRAYTTNFQELIFADYRCRVGNQQNITVSDFFYRSGTIMVKRCGINRNKAKGLSYSLYDDLTGLVSSMSTEDSFFQQMKKLKVQANNRIDDLLKIMLNDNIIIVPNEEEIEKSMSNILDSKDLLAEFSRKVGGSLRNCINKLRSTNRKPVAGYIESVLIAHLKCKTRLCFMELECSR